MLLVIAGVLTQGENLWRVVQTSWLPLVLGVLHDGMGRTQQVSDPAASLGTGSTK